MVREIAARWHHVLLGLVPAGVAWGLVWALRPTLLDLGIFVAIPLAIVSWAAGTLVARWRTRRRGEADVPEAMIDDAWAWALGGLVAVVGLYAVLPAAAS